jgi:hypothetical protein
MTSEFSLFVTGVPTVLKPDPRVQRLIEYRNHLKNKPENTRMLTTKTTTKSSTFDSEVLTKHQENWEKESNNSEWSETSQRFSIWVDIKEKPVNKLVSEEQNSQQPSASEFIPLATSTPPASKPIPQCKILVKPTGLPILFQNFIDKSYAMIAEVEAAKQLSYNNQIISVEDNFNWKSEAPRPGTTPPLKRESKKRGKRTSKVKKPLTCPVIELFPAVQTIRLGKKIRDSSNFKEKKKRILKKKPPKRKMRNLLSSIPKSSRSLNPITKRVDFILPDSEKSEHRARRRKIKSKPNKRAKRLR